jgi:hypothetical protein
VLHAAQPLDTADQPVDTGEQQPAETADTAKHSIETTEVPTHPTHTTDQQAARTKRTPRVPPATRAALISELQTLEAQIKQIRHRLRGLPARVQLSTLGPLPQTPQLESKLIGDVVKIAAYNAQSWLADRLARHYLNTHDLHDLLRSFAELSGRSSVKLAVDSGFAC